MLLSEQSFPEKRGESSQEFFHQRVGRDLTSCLVAVRTWQNELVISPKPQEKSGQHHESDAPCVWDVSGRGLQISGQHDEQSLSGNGGNAVEGTSDTHKQGLLVGVQPQHVETVGRNVVCGRTECHEPEDG